MALPLSTVSNKTMGWLTIILLLGYIALVLPFSLAMDSRMVFGIISGFFVLWCLLLALRMIGTVSKPLGWGILFSLAAVVILAVLFTSKAMPFAYVLLLFVVLAAGKLIRFAGQPSEQ